MASQESPILWSRMSQSVCCDLVRVVFSCWGKDLSVCMVGVYTMASISSIAIVSETLYRSI